MRLAPTLLCCLSLAALCGCVATQKIPVSTDPGGAAVYLDGAKVCEATPCSVEAKTDQNHLLTIVKEGYRQKDVTLRLARTSAGKTVLTPDIVTLKLRTPDQPDLTDRDSAVGTAIDIGTELLQRVLKDTAQPK